MPHFSGDISLGQIILSLTVIVSVLRMTTALDGMGMEHEMLIDDYCERRFPGLPLEEARKRLITRRRRYIFSVLLSGGRRD